MNTANVNVFFRRALQQTDQPQLTSDGAGLTGARRRPSRTTTHGDRRLVPAADRRRPPLDAEHQRPARQDPAHQGQGRRHHRRRRQQGRLRHAAPARTRSRPGTCSRSSAARRRPRRGPRSTRWASATRSGSRSTRTTSPTSATTRRTPTRRSAAAGPAGVGRFEIVRKPSNYGWPIVLLEQARLLQVELPRVRCRHHHGGHAADAAAADRLRRPDRSSTTRAGTSRAARANEPGLREIPPVTDPDIWYSYNDNRAVNPLGTPCFGYYATTPGPIAPGLDAPSARGCSRSSTRAASAPHGIAKYNYDPANPNPKKFPPYYDESVILGEFTQDTLRELKLDSQNRVFKINNFLDCGAANAANPPFLFECDNPMDMQFGRRRRVLPADLRRRVLRHQRRRRHVQVGVRQGHSARRRPCSPPTGPTARLPLTVNFSSAGSLDEDPGDSIRFEWDFGDGSPISDRAQPDAHLHAARPLHGRADGDRLLGQADLDEHDHHRRQHQPDGRRSNAPLDGGTFAFGDKHPVQGHGHRPGGPVDRLRRRRRSRSCSATTRTATPRQSVTGCTGFLQTDRRGRRRTAATCSA